MKKLITVLCLVVIAAYLFVYSNVREKRSCYISSLVKKAMKGYEKSTGSFYHYPYLIQIKLLPAEKKSVGSYETISFNKNGQTEFWIFREVKKVDKNKKKTGSWKASAEKVPIGYYLSLFKTAIKETKHPPK